jgi:hypothetical protein
MESYIYNIILYYIILYYKLLYIYYTYNGHILVITFFWAGKFHQRYLFFVPLLKWWCFWMSWGELRF